MRRLTAEARRTLLLISRRILLLNGLLVAPALACPNAHAQSGGDEIQSGLADLERARGGRLGVCVVDVASGRRVEHRGAERFAMCSTSKFISAAFVLKRVDAGEDTLERRVAYTKETLVTYSPVTEKHIGDGLTLGEICEAALTLSDNTAANLMFESFGGPPALTQFVRSLGDEVTRFDRIETALNEATPGDPRDTTTPAAMAENVRKLVVGDALSAKSRDQLAAWMVANKTGDERLRAGLPKSWRVGDKTGSGDNGAANDIAVIWPPDRDPIVVTAYFAESSAPRQARNAVLAEVGRLAVKI
jgi:beta-lactamase class A